MMAAEKENVQKPNFRLKLLSDNSVVLVEANNYDSEIFVPQIVNGRITFLNIIPNRRCCRVGKVNALKFVMKDSASESPVKFRKFGRHSAGELSEISAPLANSTPTGVKQRISSGVMSAQNFLNFNPYKNSSNCSLPSPEPVRRAVPAIPNLLENSMLNLHPGFKVAKNYHNFQEGMPKKVGRLVTTTTNVSGNYNSANMSVLNGSFRLPNSPSLSKNTQRKRSAATIGHSTATDSIARWEKVLTPVRTYIKNSKKPVIIRRSVSVESAKKALKPIRVTPTYLVNPTQALNTAKEKIKKRKLIIDSKISISPKTFKKQQNEPPETYQTVAQVLQANSLCFHKPRPYLESMAMSAFDLLTNSNRFRLLNNNLNQQFRKGCVNKASSTYGKYKVLCSVPTLQQDEEVLNHFSCQPNTQLL